MNSKRLENLIGHATINSIRSRKFFPLSCIKRDFATPKMFPIEAAEAKKLSSTIEWKYLYQSMNKYDAQLKSSLIF